MAENGRTLAQRVEELMAGRNKTLVARAAGLSRTQLLSIMDGGTKHPRIETLDALAPVLGTTRDWLLYEREQGEEDITTMAQLHSWEMKIAGQRERHIRRILHAQQDAMASKLRSALPAEQAELMAELLADTQREQDQADLVATPPGQQGTAA